LLPISLQDFVTIGQGRDDAFSGDGQAAGNYGKLHSSLKARAACQRLA